MPEEVAILATDPRDGYAAVRSSRTYIMSLGQAIGGRLHGGRSACDSGPNHLRTVDLIDEGNILTRYHIPLSPGDDEVAGTVLARGLTVEEADRRSIDVVKGLLNGAVGDTGILSMTPADGRCQLVL
jgi:hypothetical protein